MKKAVIYARYSSDSQSEQSIEGQMHVCQDYARNNQIVILDTFIDRAMTGTNDNRPAFQRMLAESKKKEWDYVLVYKFDRFSRDKYQTAIHKRALKDNGVQVISATEYLPDSPEKVIIESLLEGYAEYYSAELSQKVKRGMRETRIKGNYTGGNLIYGYKKNGKKVVIDEEKAQVVRFMYEQYAVGVFVKDIIAYLTNRGIYNNGKPFATNTVYNILRNEKYSGVYRYKDEVFTNIYPAIISPKTYEIVRNKFATNQYGKRSVDVVYLLRNKIKCGYCGSSITAETGTSKNGDVRRYYKCIGRKHHNGCTKLMVRKEYLEEFVINSTIEFLKNETVIDNLVNTLLEYQEGMFEENHTLSLLLREKAQHETALNNIVSAIEQGIVNNTTGRRMKELEEQLLVLEEKIMREKGKLNEKVTATDIKEYYERALRLEAQTMISYLIKEIRLFDDKIEIQYNSPISESPDNSQGFLIYREIRNMPEKAVSNQERITKLETEIYA